MLEKKKRTATLRMKPGNDVNMSFPSGVCRWQRNGTACCHGQRVCCTIIESWFVIAWRWGPVASTAGQWRPLSCWGARPGSFFRRSLAVVQATNAPRDGTKGPTHLGTAKPQTARCTLRVALQACGVQARPVFQAPGTRPAESHA